jgi:hypothetical protein
VSGTGSSGDGCVEVAESPEGAVVVRNSRRLELGGLSFTRREWNAFVRGIKDGEFDLPGEPYDAS